MTAAEKREFAMLLGKWAERRVQLEEDGYRSRDGRAITDAKSDAVKLCATELQELLAKLSGEEAPVPGAKDEGGRMKDEENCGAAASARRGATT